MEEWHRSGSAGVEAGPPPTLIVHGELDVLIPAANTAPLAARWPGAKVEVLPGCGHAVMAQEPEPAVAMIRRLVDAER
jgi:pimeloyl-[acyl-carrier protein] methyl ester esterase